MFSIQLVSKETIKPSSPTPTNLRHLHLSLLDQLAPPVHVALTLFYSGNGMGYLSHRLKKSLSEVLTCFYPLAGRIKYDPSGYIHVECNDQGVDVYEVRVNCKLCEFLSQPSTEELNRIMPYMVSKDVPLVIQLSSFNCCGLAIGVFASHKIMDGYSGSVFIKTWAEATRRGGDVLKQVSPIFDFASVFPPRPLKKEKQEDSIVLEKLVTKRFLFDVSKIALIRKRSALGDSFFPTFAEAVTALIWRCAMRAKGKEGIDRKLVAMQAVSIRRRMAPQLSEYSIGNLWIPASVMVDRKSDKVGYLERALRESVEKVKDGYIREVLNGEEMVVVGGYSWKLGAKEWEKDGFDFLFFINWFTLPFSESDFGWGKPECFSVGGAKLKNCVVLAPSRNGGIETWVTMVEEEMCKFEEDPELLEFVSVNPRSGYKEKGPLLEAKL